MLVKEQYKRANSSELKSILENLHTMNDSTKITYKAKLNSNKFIKA